LFAHFNQETGANDPDSEIPFWRQGLAQINNIELLNYSNLTLKWLFDIDNVISDNDKRFLLENPDVVFADDSAYYHVSFWFAGFQTGFGVTTNIINGGLECSVGSNVENPKS